MSKGIGRFTNKDDVVNSWPKKDVDKELVVAYLATKFSFEISYSEPEVNDILKQWHTFDDWLLLRRELFDRDYFDRTPDGSVYKRLK